MAKQLQLRRGTTTEHSSFTGAIGEVTVDTDKDVVVVHDGSTAGGFAMAKESDITNMLESTDIGSTVQGYDADTTKNDVANTFTASQRGTVTTDNDLSFDMDASNNFKCTPTANGTFTFTNITAGQSGNILLVNTTPQVISCASTTYISASDLTAINVAGTYWLSYYSDGTNVYVSASQALTSAGA